MNVWQEFFDLHAPDYMKNIFVKNTLAEVDFLLEELQLAEGSRILDVGCGTGRHAVELARRGYRMTGVDLSPGMLEQARRAAAEAGVELELIQSDVADFKAPHEFDAAICLCEGGFGLLSQARHYLEHPLAILKNVSAALKPGGKAIFTVLNGMKMIRQHTADDVASGKFDPLTLSEVNTIELDTPAGPRSFTMRERGFVPGELEMLFARAGLETLYMGGGTAGDWGRRAIDPDEFEIMVIARRNDGES